MQRVIVIGSPGSGKSTFSRGLRDITGLPLCHLDLLWHKPDRTTVTEQEFDEKLESVLTQERWIIDGNYSRTLERRLERCDTVFLLDFPVEVCLAGVAARMGKPREDLPWQETEPDPEFQQFIIDFPRDRLPGIYRLLEEHRGDKQIVVFRSREEAKEYLRRRKGDLRPGGEGAL